MFKQSRATHVCNIPYIFLFSHIEQSWYSIQVCLFQKFDEHILKE